VQRASQVLDYDGPPVFYSLQSFFVQLIQTICAQLAISRRAKNEAANLSQKLEAKILIELMTWNYSLRIHIHGKVPKLILKGIYQPVVRLILLR